MLTTINGKIYGAPELDDTTTPSRATIRIFAEDPDNPNWLLDVHAHATGHLAQTIAEQARHRASITATGDKTRTSPLPGDSAAGTTTASLILQNVTITP